MMLIGKLWKTKEEYEAYLRELADRFKGTPDDRVISRKWEAGEIIETLVIREGRYILRIHVLDCEVELNTAEVKKFILDTGGEPQ